MIIFRYVKINVKNLKLEIPYVWLSFSWNLGYEAYHKQYGGTNAITNWLSIDIIG